MKDPISSSSFRVSFETDAMLNGSFPLVANEAPSMMAPGTAVIGSGANTSPTPTLRSVFEREFGFATCFNLSSVALSARDPAIIVRSFRIRVAELALDLRS